MNRLRIDQLFAFVVKDEDGNEGVPAIDGAMAGYPGMVLPMMGADLSRVEDLRPYAEAIATGMGREVRLVVFSLREEREVFPPTREES